MTGLLWSAVRAGDLELSPDSKVALARKNLDIRQRHLGMWEAMEELGNRFDRAGIDVAAIKGVTAEARWYDGPGARPCVDVDLLLSPTHLDRLEECVALVEPDHPMRGRLYEAVIEAGMQSVQLWGPGRVSVDLHVDPLKLGIPTRGTDQIWARCTDLATPADGKVRVLDPESSLILFLFHVLKDRFARLLGLVDLVRIVDREDLDWQFIDDFLHDEGLEVPAYLTLQATYEALDLDPPATPEVTGWRAAAWRTLWPEQDRLQGRLSQVRHHRRQALLPLLGRGRAREGMARIWHAAFPPEVVLDYHDPDTPGPYPWRLLVGRAHRIIDRRRTARSVRTK